MQNNSSLESFMRSVGGVASVAELARFLGEPKSLVRELASELPNARMIGGAYILDLPAAAAIAEAIAEADEDDEDEDDWEGDDGDDEEEEDEDDL